MNSGFVRLFPWHDACPIHPLILPESRPSPETWSEGAPASEGHGSPPRPREGRALCATDMVILVYVIVGVAFTLLTPTLLVRLLAWLASR